MTAPRHELAAQVVRDQIADGTLKPGREVPYAAALASSGGLSAEAFLGAFRVLLAEGVLVPGAGRNTRLRVAAADSG